MSRVIKALSSPQAAFERAIAQLGEKELEPEEWGVLVGNVNGFRARSYLPSMLTAFRLTRDKDGNPINPNVLLNKPGTVVKKSDFEPPSESRGFYRLYRIPGWRGLMKRALWILRFRSMWPYSRFDRWVHVRNEAFLSKAKYWVGGRHSLGKAMVPPGYATKGVAA